MVWTYTAASTADRDTVRRLSGDTDSAAPGVQDEVIDAFLTLTGSTVRAAIAVVDVLIAEAARQTPVTFPGGTVDLSAPYEKLKERRAQLYDDLSRAGRPSPAWTAPLTDAAFTRVIR